MGNAADARKVLSVLNNQNLSRVGAVLYNSLEAPALKKYPLLVMFQEFFREHGADATLMSGSGSTTFAIARSEAAGQQLAEEFKGKFGTEYWVRWLRHKAGQHRECERCYFCPKQSRFCSASD